MRPFTNANIPWSDQYQSHWSGDDTLRDLQRDRKTWPAEILPHTNSCFYTERNHTRCPLPPLKNSCGISPGEGRRGEERRGEGRGAQQNWADVPRTSEMWNNKQQTKTPPPQEQENTEPHSRTQNHTGEHRTTQENTEPHRSRRTHDRKSVV